MEEKMVALVLRRVAEISGSSKSGTPNKFQ